MLVASRPKTVIPIARLLAQDRRYSLEQANDTLPVGRPLYHRPLKHTALESQPVCQSAKTARMLSSVRNTIPGAWRLSPQPLRMQEVTTPRPETYCLRHEKTGLLQSEWRHKRRLSSGGPRSTVKDRLIWEKGSGFPTRNRIHGAHDLLIMDVWIMGYGSGLPAKGLIGRQCRLTLSAP